MTSLSKRLPTRHFWVLAHRYAGLYLTFWLLVAGASGSLLAFYNELEAWLNPGIFTVAVQDKPLLDAFTLTEKAQMIEPGAKFDYIAFQDVKPDRTFIAYAEAKIDPATKKPYELGFESLVLNPYTGAEIRRTAARSYWPLGRENIMGFIYALHYKLALPGEWGMWLFGIAAVIWTFDCFVGFYLTLPMRRKTKVSVVKGRVTKGSVGKSSGYFTRWKPAWLIRWQSSAYKINFDLHRAGGLWVWAMLFVFAWSSVQFNLRDQVYNPVMKTVFGMVDAEAGLPEFDPPLESVRLDVRAAHVLGRQYMAAQAAQHGFTVARESSLHLQRDRGTYRYSVFSSRDVNQKNGSTAVIIDANTGAFKSLSLPSGQNGATTFTSWITTLHMGKIWGLPMQIFVCAMGLLIVMLSITGLVIWLKKRKLRVLKQFAAKTRELTPYFPASAGEFPLDSAPQIIAAAGGDIKTPFVTPSVPRNA